MERLPTNWRWSMDDAEMLMTDVVRGDDLLESAARQIVVIRSARMEVPGFRAGSMCRWLIGTDGRRLAKRHGDTRLGTLSRQHGVSPGTDAGPAGPMVRNGLRRRGGH
jgi:glutamyl-tRNA synthetase